MSKWLRALQGGHSLAERRQSFLRAARVFLAIFMVAAVLGIARFAWALRSHRQWVNYRGDPVTQSELIRGLVVLGLAGLLSAVAFTLIVRARQGSGRSGGT